MRQYSLLILQKEVAMIIDKIKDFGFRYSSQSGTTLRFEGCSVPIEKSAIIEKGISKVDKIKDSYNEGLLSEEKSKTILYHLDKILEKK